MKQVNARCALLLRLASSEAVVDSRSHGILNVEGVDGFMKWVRAFQFPALMHPDLFQHRSTRYYHYASWRFQETRNRSQYPRRRKNLTWLKSPSLSPGVSGALGHKFDGVHMFAGHEATPVSTMQQLHSSQRKELEDLRAQLDTSEAHTRQREGKLKAYSRQSRPSMEMRVPQPTHVGSSSPS